MIDERDTDTIFHMLIRFIPKDMPLADEMEAIARADESIEKNGTIAHEDVKWD